MKPIRGVQIGGELKTLVECPERRQTMDLDECVRCERFDCVHIDGERRTLLLRCKHAEPSRPTPLGDLMPRVTVCVTPATHLEEIRRLFLEHGISGMPVVDARGRAIGIVSKTDLLEPHRGAHARDLMMPIVFSLPATAQVGQAAALMALEGIHRIAVVGVDGALLGVVSSLDVMRWLAVLEGWLTP
jgi:CBS domain-containing protein